MVVERAKVPSQVFACGKAKLGGASQRPNRAATGGLIRCATASLSLVACGDGNTAPVAAEQAAAALEVTQPQLALEQPTPFYRLDLRRDEGGTIELVRVSAAVLSEQPVPALSAPYLVFARAPDGAALAAVPLVFQQVLRSMARETDGGWSEQLTQLATSAGTVFVPALSDGQRLEVTTPDMQVALEVLAEELEPYSSLIEKAVSRPGLSHELGKLTQGLTNADLEARYPQIHFLLPGDGGELPAGFTYGGPLMDRSSSFNDAIAAGLDALAPTVRNSIQTIGEAQMAGEGYNLWGAALGPHLILNSNTLTRSSDITSTVVHEAAHNFVDLTSASAGALPSDSQVGLSDWSTDAARLASEIVSRFRLVNGLAGLWASLHQAGIAAKYATPYTGRGGGARTPPSAALDGGFASPYGSETVGEDIAEYVMSVQLPSSTSPNVCSRFSGVAMLSPALATSFAKLVVLRGVGALTQSAYGGCVGGISIGASQGIRLDGIGTFTDQFRAGFATGDSNDPVFNVLASGADDQLLLQLALDEPRASPLGLHRLDYVNFATIAFARSRSLYANDRTNEALASDSGLVLVTEFSTASVGGAVFGLTLQDAFGFDHYSSSYGTFAGDL